VRANHDRRIGFAWDGRDDAVLAPGVLEVLGVDVALGAGGDDCVADLAEEPLA
jgi:hypothetical protein